MRNKAKIMATILFFITSLFLYAGDIAEFVNLGFSENGKHFLFGQYGYQAEATRMYADLFLVDVKANRFVQNGVHRGGYGQALQPGQSPEGALFTLLRSIHPQLEQYKIQHIRRGRPLYFRVADNSDGVNLDFRDFQTGWHYEVSLNQTILGEGDDVESSFYIDVKRDKNGTDVTSYQVGLPDYRRKKVSQYTIEQILLGPDEQSLVFVIAKTEYSDDSPNIRYMVETLTP